MKSQTAGAIASGADFDFPDPQEPLTILVPTPVATYCYLYEALLWIALQRYPLVSQWESSDVRLDSRDMEGIHPRIEFEPFSDDECDRAGLPHDPEYAAWNEGSGPPSDPQFIRRLAEGVPDEEERRELLSELPKAEAYASAVSAWEEQCDEFLDVPKSKLFLALREGKLAAYGKRIPKQIAESFPEPLSHKEWHSWTIEPWQVIAPNHWRSSGIDWEGCRANAATVDYALVLVSMVQLTISECNECLPWVKSPPLSSPTFGSAPFARGRVALGWKLSAPPSRPSRASMAGPSWRHLSRSRRANDQTGQSWRRHWRRPGRARRRS